MIQEKAGQCVIIIYIMTLYSSIAGIGGVFLEMWPGQTGNKAKKDTKKEDKEGK